ncbi:MAG TPA: protein kinase [Polyangiales bacterium]|nr:protein kinase [Polyangiales bacterium]
MVRHLDEDTVILLAQGALGGGSLERAEEHLAQCDACRSLLAESLQDAEHALADPDATQAVPVLDGSLDVPPVGAVLVDKYRVESVIGSGGMGVVLAATHLVLGSKVAIKVLRRTGASEIARFLREARIAAQVKNRHIVRVFDFGQLPSGAPFLVMEFLEGRDLAQSLEAGPLPVPLAVDYVLQACEAIAQVHELGIVHRDLKPANLFLGEDSLVKVLDFGIFKSIGGALDLASTALTGQHAVIGSPVYMSPEQMRGGDVDARSDVWSLGVILYELTTAQLPFGERTLSALAIAVASEDPVPPSKLRPELGRELEQVILRCLRKRPEERYLDAGALRTALRALPGKRSRGGFTIALATVALAAGAWWLLGQQPERPGPRAVALPVPVAEGPAPVTPEPVLAPQPPPEPARLEPDAGRPKKRAPKRSAKLPIGPTDTPD